VKHITCIGKMRNACRILVGSPERKRQFRNQGCRCEDNIKTNIKEVVFDGVEWIHLVYNRALWRALVNTTMNHRVP
jgi:hypothetical protein